MQDFALAPQTDLSAIDASMLAGLSLTDRRDLLELVDAQQANQARDDFTVYCRRVIPGFIASPFHVELCELLMAVERGDIRKLLIEAPVRIGKTRLISETAPAWCMARRAIPTMLCSYGAKLAHRSSRRVRNLIMSERHLSVFPEARLSEDATSVDMFETENGSSLVAAGTNGPIGGSGFLMGFLDDLLKGREAADSPIQRDAVWEWYQGDFMSREELPSGIVFVTARWHDDDPAGRIRELVKDEVEDWTIRTYAALDENDESLCEELRPAEELKRIRSERPSRYWQSLYMSDPVGESGDVYRRDWFVASARRWTPQDGRDGTVRFYAVSDIATMDGAGDFTVHIIFAVDVGGALHIVEIWREQASPAAWVDEMLRLASRWRPQKWGFGKGALFNAVEPLIRKTMAERRCFVVIDTYAETRDPVARSQSFAGRMENDRVRWNEPADWYPQAESELLRFPAGKTDDVADACSIIGLMVDKLSNAASPAPPPEPTKIFTLSNAPLPEGQVRATWADVRDSHMRHRKRERRGERGLM